MSAARQLDLFGNPQVQQLQAEVTWLRSRLDTAKTEYRKLRDAAAAKEKRLEAMISLAIQERDQAQQQARYYKASAELLQMVQRTFPATPAMDPTLKHLLALAHPDKWSQGQPASVLAHELAVAINGMREKQGVA